MGSLKTKGPPTEVTRPEGPLYRGTWIGIYIYIYIHNVNHIYIYIYNYVCIHNTHVGG